MALQNQINILSVDTGNFYSNREMYLHNLNHKVRMERNYLKPVIAFYDNCLLEFGFSQRDISYIKSGQFDRINYVEGSSLELKDILDYYNLYQIYLYKGKKAKETKNRILTLLKNKVDENNKSNGKHHVRKLRFVNSKFEETEYTSENIISVFDSSFTRMIGAKINEFTDDFMVIQVYYFDVIKDLIYNGFEYLGNKYIYFTSSAGQIRTKKCVFVKESVWNKYEKTIMCGLTIDSINAKGGNNSNKHLAYLALNNSATDEWKEFDIDKTIVIDDFETNVSGVYDLVDDADYTIKRINGNVPITHTDGCGMMLPCMGKNRMVRLPWVKGLLGSFDFIGFIKKFNYSPIIKDIYGKEHNIIEEDIKIIFTKSQFKLYKYYSSWDEYKDNFKKYGCSAGYTNMEESRVPNATINYQMLQSLTDVSDDEIKDIVSESVDKLNSICDSVDTIKSILGVTPYNQSKTYLQKSIELYPELINDAYIKQKIKDIKDSYIKSFKAGKLKIKGKYTFILPDLFAACEFWFGHIDNPKGLLNDGEVFCLLFKKNKELDCLRSPHLYREHAIRKNVACFEYEERQEEIREWFGTNAVYTSCHDLISKILQFDVDGDNSLVVADESFIKVAKRNMNGVVPLYYNMKKASPTILNNDSIYNGLSNAFTGSNIGIYSNNISKIWNSDVFINGTDDEKKEAIDIIKFECMLNNFKIDYAKTLYMPEEPNDIKKKKSKFINKKLPAFFVYAKDKEEEQTELPNQSFVNKISKLIPNPRISFKYIDSEKHTVGILDKPDYRYLMTNPDMEISLSKESDNKKSKNSNPIILLYNELSTEYGQKIYKAYQDTYSQQQCNRSELKHQVVYNKLSKEIKEKLSQFGDSDEYVADILITYLYGIKNSKHKEILWSCYGDILFNNLSNYFKKDTRDIQCVDCGEWFEVYKFDSATCRCNCCQVEHKRMLERLKKQRYRARKGNVPPTI